MKLVKLFILAGLLVGLVGCASQSKKLELSAKDNSCICIGSITSTVNVNKEDEKVQFEMPWELDVPLVEGI